MNQLKAVNSSDTFCCWQMHPFSPTKQVTGFHASAITFSVPGTSMIELTESESKEELNRFIGTMMNIYE